MVRIISSSYLKSKLTGGKLRDKVGTIKINCDGNRTRENLGGVALKKFIVSKMGGRTGTQIEKMLKEKYGVSDNQIGKRNRIMELIEGDGKASDGKGSLVKEKERDKKNLRLGEQKDSGPRRQTYKTRLVDGGVRITSLGATADKPASVARQIKGSMEDLGFKRNIGFAQRNQPTNNPSTKPPPGGIRPLDL